MYQLSPLVIVLAASISPILFAQKGTAPPGFYPPNYHGDTFSGEVIKVEGEKTLTLQYSHGAKTEIFTGTIADVCRAPLKSDAHDLKELHLSAIPQGTVLTVFYNPEKKKAGDTTQIENVILGIRFDRVNGKTLTNPDRPVIVCSKGGAGVRLY